MREREIWKNALSSLETRLSKAIVVTFFQETELTHLSDEGATVSCPNRLIADHLKSRHADLIGQTLASIIGARPKLSFEVKNALPNKPQELGPIFRARENDGLSSSYTFNNFIVGLSNQLAVSATKAVVGHPGGLHNPLFLYSGVGLGKTHLLHALGNALKEGDPSLSVLYCPAEKFTNELIQSIQDQRSASRFRKKYRSLDVLLVDDIQFIAGREATQEEFFNTFNELYISGKQIVLASDRNPGEIQKLEERLVSRFMGGLVADIQEPDLDLRLAILRQKTKEQGESMQEEVLLALAQQITGNIRQLEGALHQLLSFALSTPASSSDLLLQITKHLPQPKQFGPEEIVKAVCHHFSLNPDVLRSPSRTKETVLARQVAAYLLRNLGQTSLSKIGDLLGGRDHTTVLYGIEKIEKELTQNLLLRNRVEAAKVEILGKTF